MKSQHQQIRDILDAAQYPVDPKHESDFKAVLLNDRKRRRRNILWFVLCCLGMLMSGYGVLSALKEPPEPAKETEHTIDPAASVSVLPPHKTSFGASVESGIRPEVTETLQGAIDEKNAGNSGLIPLAGNPAVISQTTQQVINKKSSTTSLVDPLSIGILRESFTGELPAENDVSIKTKITVDEVDVAIVNPVQSANAPETEHATSVDLLNTALTYVITQEREIAESGPIVPTLQKSGRNRVHYGLSGALYPATGLLAKSEVKAGYGFHLGSYATYAITPRLQFRADAGFSRLDGGFTYLKESTTEEYGFTLSRNEHSLSVQKLYSGFASAEIGLKRGKHMFCFGLQGQYLYGARGDIQRMEYAQDVQSQTVYTSENVWLETEDMRKIALQGIAGVRAQIKRRLELAALIHIPITQTLKQPAGTSRYQYRVKTHGVYPQFTLSYQINQQ